MPTDADHAVLHGIDHRGGVQDGTTVQAARQYGLTAAEKFWYVLGCIMFGAAYLKKVPVKRALADFGLVEMTSAESFWYVLGCIFPLGLPTWPRSRSPKH
jgi:hypothetical protein